MDDKLPRITDLAEGRDKPKEKDYIDFFQDVEKGLLGGVQDLGYAIGDLLTSGIDAAADTNLTEELTKVYEENKIKDPETLTGEITKLLTQYGVPGGGVFKVLNRVKALSKARKVKKRVQVTKQSTQQKELATCQLHLQLQILLHQNLIEKAQQYL